MPAYGCSRPAPVRSAGVVTAPDGRGLSWLPGRPPVVAHRARLPEALAPFLADSARRSSAGTASGIFVGFWIGWHVGLVGGAPQAHRCVYGRLSGVSTRADGVTSAKNSLDRSLKSFLLRGVLHFGIPVAMFSFTTVFLRMRPDGWRAMLSVKFLIALIFG